MLLEDWTNVFRRAVLFVLRLDPLTHHLCVATEDPSSFRGWEPRRTHVRTTRGRACVRGSLDAALRQPSLPTLPTTPLPRIINPTLRPAPFQRAGRGGHPLLLHLFVLFEAFRAAHGEHNQADILICTIPSSCFLILFTPIDLFN